MTVFKFVAKLLRYDYFILLVQDVLKTKIFINNEDIYKKKYKKI